MKRIYTFFKVCFFLVVLAVLAGGIGAYLLVQKYTQDLPNLNTLKDYAPPVISEVYSDNGTKIGEFWTERRIVLSPQEIPKLLEQAIIASEDDRFFEHSGLDYFGIFRAMIENLKAGRVVQGGSTITQQVVKTFLLTRDRKLERKIKEAVLSIRLEERFSKQEILYLYLNQIYLGNKSYGIEAAAQNYFHKSAKELNIAEAAMIVGLAKAPGKFDPTINFERAKERQEYVIDRMFQTGIISNEQKSRAINFPLTIYKAPTDKEFNQRHAPWFVEEVRRMLLEKYGKQAVYTQGLQIYTTLDLEAQKAADYAVWRGLSELHKRHGYNGPIKTLPSSQYQNFIYQTQKSLFYDALEPGIILPNITQDAIMSKKIKLDPEKTYKALVVDIDKAKKAAVVQVGNNKGMIIDQDFGWARKRNNAAHGWDGNIYVRNPAQVFNLGDVVEVKLIDPKTVAAKNQKLYDETQTYFSLEQTPKIEGALFSYDVHSGYVKAIVGGKDFRDSEFNRATQALRQTGSVFKPFLYSAALDKGYRPDTIIEDEPLKIPDGPGRFWQPKNYGGGYKGPMTFQSALIASRNVVSVRIILDIGVDYVTGAVRKLGITSPIAKVYSMSLGSNEMHLSEVARAFGTFPTGGILPDLIYIKSMKNRFGSVLEKNVPKKVMNFQKQIEEGLHKQKQLTSDLSNNTENLRPDLWTEAQKAIKRDQLRLTPFEEIILYGNYIPEGYVMNPKTAYTMVSIMRAIVTSGTGYKVNELKRPAAGKTGTTNDQTDCWFVGYTPNIAAGVWTGYDQTRFKVGGGETGGKSAAPIFLYYMQEYLKDKPVAQFDIPSNMGYAALNPPIEVFPGDLSNLFSDTDNAGGADFFSEDL